MTERSVSGDAVRSKYKAAQKLADELSLTPEAMDAIADGAREFDAFQSPDARQARALEKIAAHFLSQHAGGDGSRDHWKWEQQRLRRREVAALELLAVVPVATDEELEKIQAGAVYRKIIERLSSDAPSTP